MAKFVYRMQNILNLYTKLEDEAKIAFSIANNALVVEQNKLKKINDEEQAYENHIRDMANGKLDVQELKRCNDAIAVKKMEAETQKTRIIAAQKNVDKAAMKLKGLMRDRKTQETLREKAFDSFVREINEAESKEIDQVVSYQFNSSKEGN